jgi:hypothetical protein
MTVKFYLKNLNVSQLDKNLFTEINDIDTSLNVNKFIHDIAERLRLDAPAKLGKIVF